MKVLTLKPVRAGQGIGRGGAQRNPCNWASNHQLTPLGVTDCVPMAAAPMGLECAFSTVAGVALGFASLHPCLSPGRP